MRNVLFIAYDFPPGAGIGAGLRSASFACYLPEFGWRPEVIALDEGQVPTPGVSRLRSRTPWHRPYELTPYGWSRALRRYLAREHGGALDLVYVSCPPFPQALPAAAYAHGRRLPLVVDFRDAWTLDPYQEGSRLKRWLYRHVFPTLERRLLARTTLLILNTPSALAAYQRLYPTRSRCMTWLPNGYDEQAFPALPLAPDNGRLVLLYAGRFGIGARSPTNLLRGLAMARRQGCRVTLEVVGAQTGAMAPEIRAAGLDGAVRQRGQVDHHKAVAAMCAADVLVLMQAPSRATVQAVAGKTFEYLRAGRPILAITPPGDNLELVRQYAHRYEHPNDDPAAIAQAISRLHSEWSAGLLKPAGVVHPEFRARYERRALAGTLAAHFDRLVAAA